MRPLAILGFLAISAASFAWIDTGHMIVAAIAEPELKPDATAEINRLLAIGGDERHKDFLGASCWSDDAKTPENGPWHYINLHFRSDGKPTPMEPLKENVIMAIHGFRRVLRDRSRPDAERAEALRHLIHFVGDVHQPMHNVARDTEAFPSGDRGGNDFKFDPFPLAGFEVRNLHFLWDIAGGLYGAVERPLKDRAAIDSVASRLRQELPRASLAEMAATDVEAWSRESGDLARAVSYSLEENKRPSEAYLAACRHFSERRLALAGYRLADLLNAVLAEQG